MSSELIASIERNIKEKKNFVDMSNALQRLKSNKDFKSLILDGYFEKEAVRLVHLKAAPDFQTPEKQKAVLDQIDAIGSLSGYFATITFNANQAGKAIEADEETLLDLRNEGNE